MPLYGISEKWLMGYVVGVGAGIGLKVIGFFIPAFTIAIPFIMGLSLAGNIIVIVLLAPIVEEIFFRGIMLGFLTKKGDEPPPIDNINRTIMLIVLSFFIVGFILTLQYFTLGLVYTILAFMSLVVYIFWKHIPTLNLPFLPAALIDSGAFSAYHVYAYAKILALSAILPVYGAFIAAFTVGMLACYLLKSKWGNNSLTAPIGIHQCFNALLLVGKYLVLAGTIGAAAIM